MNIVKALQPGLLHRTFGRAERNYFTASLLWGFRLSSGEPVLEINLWTAIGETLGKNEMFDAGMPKTRPEVLAVGSFHAPNGRPVQGGKASLRLGAVRKELAVFGARRWTGGPGITRTISDPEPITQMPLTYANAFGGEGFVENPVGRGFRGSDSPSPSLPNVEYPDSLIAAPTDRPRPASFARVDIMWKQRLSRAGTYDKKYLRERMPGFPDDIDWTYFNDAAPDQWFDDYLTGDEPFELASMHPTMSVQRGYLPGVRGRCFVNRRTADGSRVEEVGTKLDTVWFFPGDDLGVVIHRGTVEVEEDDGTDITQLLIAHENLSDDPRSLDHYREELHRRTDPAQAYKYMMYTVPLLPEGCRCGFDIIKESSNMPLEHLTRTNAEAYRDKKRTDVESAVAEELEQAGEKMEDAELNPADHPEMLKLPEVSPPQSEETQKIEQLMEAIAPGITTDPANLDITKLNLEKFDALTAYMQQLKEDKQKQATELIEAGLAEADSQRAAADSDQTDEESSEVLGKDAVVAELREKLKPSASAPVLPRIHVEEGIEAARAQMVEANEEQKQILRSMGMPEEELATMLPDTSQLDAVREQMRDAQRKARAGYLMGAHRIDEARSPHEGREQEIGDALLARYAEKSPTAEGDYAFVDLCGQDLSGIDLHDSYLEYVDLRGANLTGANLSGVILTHARLDGTIVRDADLRGANLGASRIVRSDFSGADLTGAILGKADISESSFVRCKLTDKMEMFLEAKLRKVDFTGADLRRCNFMDVDLTGCCFVEANLSESNVLNAQLEGVCFDRANIRSVNFVAVKAAHATFRGASGRNVRFVGGCTLTEADFAQADLSEANLRDCNLVRANFALAVLHKSDFGGSTLTDAEFTRAHAVQAQFGKADLSNARLHRINLFEGSLHKARLVGARFFEANLYSVNMLGVVLGETDFTDADLTKTVLAKWRPD